MKYSDLDNWVNGFQHDSLLFFTQRVNEMLFHFTNHVFQTPVLNTSLLADEFLNNQDLVKEGIIGSKHLKHIMDEFLSSFSNDVVLKYHVESKEKQRILRKINSLPLDNRKTIMEYTKFLLSDYILWCREQLKEAILQEKERVIIDQISKCLIPGLISSGYSHEFIFYHNIDVFYTQPVSSLQSLDVFLDRFDFKPRKYDVYIALNVRASFQKLLEENLQVCFGPFDCDVRINCRNHNYILSRIQLFALDEYSAARKAYNKLNELFRYYCFLAEQNKKWFVNQAKVVDEEQKITTTVLKGFGLSRSKGRDQETAITQLELFVSPPKTRSSITREQINRALDFHNAAVDDSDIKNRFLNFWSTLEILFVTEHKDDKLPEILNKIIPILQRDYLFYLFNYVQIEIVKLYHHMNADGFADQINEEKKDLWPLFVTIFDKYKDQRVELSATLAKYPLLKYRIDQLNELCRDKTNLMKAVKCHTKRVSWHIVRLYRTRNTIIHSGMFPDNLQELVEHLHSYSDQSLSAIINSLSKKSELYTITNVLFDIQYRMDNCLALLQEHSPLAESDLLAIWGLLD